MVHLYKRISRKKGLRPGSVVFVGDQKVAKTKITIIDYNEIEIKEMTVEKIEDCFPFRDSPTVTWINIDGLHDTSVIEKLGTRYGLHPLVMEDIANTGQRPKLEEGDGYVFIVLKMLRIEPETYILKSEQVSLVLGENFVISFQEMTGDVFDSVRDRIRKTSPRVRFMNPDYLAHALMDAIVDNYFLVLEVMGESIESLEEELVTRPKPANLELIHELKRELIYMRKAIWPLREVVGGLERLESTIIHKQTRAYLRDLYEHVIQVIDTVETFRDMVSGLLDIYLSSVSNKMNEVMKVLTIIATVFIPLGFLAGVYGMNFDTSASGLNMPELGLPYGYLLFWGLAVLIGGGMFLFFRKKGWF
nr:magnesium/cobalt transporter CorA [candidate division Zixibacteria bacterium]